MTQPEKSILAPAVLLATGLIISSVFAYLIWSAGNPGTPETPQTRTATHFPSPMALQPFNLIDHNGKTFDNSNLLEQWHFMFFGYTHCPDVCPSTLSIMSSVAHKLGENEGARFLFVTVDPARDTPEQLAGFVRYFNPGFVGLTGELDAILQLSRQLGIMSSRETAYATGSKVENYTVEHSASILLVNPDGQYAAVFSPPHSTNAIVEDFSIIRTYFDSRHQAQKQ